MRWFILLRARFFMRLAVLFGRLSAVLQRHANVSAALASFYAPHVAARLEACRLCPFYRHSFEPPTGAAHTCRKCGCYMPLKVRLPHATCPDKRWGAM